MDLCRHKTWVFKVRDESQDPPEGVIEIEAPEEWMAIRLIAILSPGVHVVELVMSFYADERGTA